MASWLRRSNSEPFFWLGNYPVFVTELLILIHSIAFFVVAIGGRIGYDAWIDDHLAYHSTDIIGRGRVWELLTYIFVPQISFWFIMSMLMLFWFGREVETHLGRKGYIFLYLCLAICPMLIFTALDTIMHTHFAGSDILHFAVFLAFASLFPEADLFFGQFQAMWVALVLLAVYSLLAIYSYAEWKTFLIALWSSSFIAIFAVRAPVFANFVDWMETHREVQEAENARKRRLRMEHERQIQEQTIDEILDKISQHGMHSLTREERAILEKARTNLLKKEKR